MDWRFFATLTACGASFALIVAVVAFAAVGHDPGDLRKTPPKIPLLVESRAASIATLELAPESQADTPLSRIQQPDSSTAAASVVTGSAALSASRFTPAVRTLTSKGTDEVIRNRLGRAPEKPSIESPPKTNLAALPTRESEVNILPRSRSPSIKEVAPSSGRPVLDRRLEGVFTDAEIGRLRLALRLTPDQVRYWPPVEAVLREIGAQQIGLVQAGRQPKEAFGTGISMRMYWAARPLLGVLREDQNAEIRKRARAMGFEQVASSI
jgi:hypothetical protein